MNTTSFVIITVISLIIAFLSFFGIFRYFNLHFKKSENFINNYKNLDKPKNNSKITISIGTTGKRLKNIRPMLNSILDQTVKVDEIFINIPECSYEYEIPNDYKSIFTILPCGKNYGIATKFIPTLLREDNADTKIIFLDDNYIYGKDFIETLINESNSFDGVVTSNKGIILSPNNIDAKYLLNINNKTNYNHEWIEKTFKNKKKISYFENYKTFRKI